MAEIDAITLIEEDHSRIRKMLAEVVGDIDIDARSALLDDIRTQIQAHSQMEVQIFYPAVRDAVGGPEAELLFHRSNLEHEIVEGLLEDVREVDPGSLEFLALMEVVHQNLELHMKLEEEVLLPRAREALGGRQLVQLAERMDELKESRIEQVAEGLAKEDGIARAPDR